MGARTMDIRVISRSVLEPLFDLTHLDRPRQFIKIYDNAQEYAQLIEAVNKSKIITLHTELTIEQQLDHDDVLLGVNSGWYKEPGVSERTQGYYTDLYVSEGNKHLSAFEQMAFMVDELGKLHIPPAGSVKDGLCWVIYIKDNQLRLSHNTWYKQ